MKFTKIPSDAFQKLAINAGVIMRQFDPTATSTAIYRGYIIGATTGGITMTATPTFADFGEDIDNCAKNTKELKRLTEYDIKASGTFVTVDPKVAKQLLAASDITVTVGRATTDTSIVVAKTYYTRTGSGTSQSPYVYTEVANPVASSLSSYYEAVESKIVPRQKLATDDFADIWFVGDYSDKTADATGGFVACKIKNALSTGGWSFVTADAEKGKFAFEFTAHYSISNPDAVPLEVYIHTGA